MDIMMHTVHLQWCVVHNVSRPNSWCMRNVYCMDTPSLRLFMAMLFSGLCVVFLAPFCLLVNMTQYLSYF